MMPETLDLNGIEEKWRKRRVRDFRLWRWLVNRARASAQRGDVDGLSKFVEWMALLLDQMVQRDTTRFIANGVRHRQDEMSGKIPQGRQMMPEQTVQRVVRDEIESALHRLEYGIARREDADLLRALFDGFNSLAQVIGVEIELTSGTDRGGRPCFYLMMMYPEELG